MSNFSNIMHLFGRIEELSNSNFFINWLRDNPSNKWHETEVNNSGEFNVIVQSDNGLSIFAARLRREQKNDNDWMHSILEQHVFNPNDIKINQVEASALALKTANVQLNNIVAHRPVVNFEKSPPELEWEIEISKDKSIDTFSILPKKEISLVTTRALEIFPKDDSKKIMSASTRNDWLASNECHHLRQWRSIARQMTNGATTTAEKVREIFQGVRQRMRYDSTIRYISEFTHSDNLTISNYRWGGVCDEWAVVQITLLRAVGIPARLKFLIWQTNGETVGHACLEYRDGNSWIHMDALWNALNYKARYRDSGATNVTVMDADYPLDRRSTTPWWDFWSSPKDPDGDQKFDPYKDFIISPSYPGNRRSGYSY